MHHCYVLDSLAKQQNYRVQSHTTVTSTNFVAANHAKQGDEGKLWVVAQEQSVGVGRRGRQWHSPKGNLYASLLLVAHYQPFQAATLGFVAGVSIVEAIENLAGNHLFANKKIQLKWPNDVLIDGAKLTGILLERLSLTNGQYGVVIGIGINVTQSPKLDAYATTNLHLEGLDVTPAQLFMELSHFWCKNFALWDEGRGMEDIRAKWLKKAARLGEEIYIETGEQKITGIFTTIDSKGQIVLEMKNGTYLQIPAGVVHFGNSLALE